MTQAIFYITLAAELLAALCVAFSIARPQRRIWPPARPNAWGGYVLWALFLLAGAGALAVGALDWGSLALPGWVRLGVGLPLSIAGNALAVWALVTLRLAASFGATGPLVQSGPYHWSRNPQYLGFMLALAGWALLSGSTLACAAALAGMLPLALVPWAEEAWLAEKLGAAYAEYQEVTPRFFGFLNRR